MVGQPFIPYRLFTGIFIPEALVRSKLVSPGAKMAYGRLARYAGQDGRCFPAVSKLAAEIGIGARQAQKYLAELEKAKLIRRRTRFSDRAQASSAFEFLWHPLFQDRVNDLAGEGVNDPSPKESQIEESQLYKENGELDYRDAPLNESKSSKADYSFASAKTAEGSEHGKSLSARKPTSKPADPESEQVHEVSAEKLSVESQEQPPAIPDPESFGRAKPWTASI
jgi:Helix-turn-helix domain